MYFDDRLDAARQLADALRHLRGTHPLVLAIPRGAVPMGAQLARQLGGDLDVVLVRKLGAPWSPELAVGSVGEDGWTYVSEFARDMGIDPAFLERERETQLALIRRRRALYTPGRAPYDPRGRTCIVLDDGIATGATMIAALHWARAHAPARLVAAAPVGAEAAVAHLRPLADEVACLFTPPGFRAVGQFYRDFDAVTDAQVVSILAPVAQAH